MILLSHGVYARSQKKLALASLSQDESAGPSAKGLLSRRWESQRNKDDGSLHLDFAFVNSSTQRPVTFNSIFLTHHRRISLQTPIAHGHARVTVTSSTNAFMHDD